jgi:hypothetical protein
VLQGFSRMEPLEPGTYEGLVVDADEHEDGTVGFEIAITTGAHKGETVRVRGPRAGRDPLEVLGLPATVEVGAQGISIRFDRG